MPCLVSQSKFVTTYTSKILETRLKFGANQRVVFIKPNKLDKYGPVITI